MAVAGGCLLSLVTSASAQEGALGDVYGRGVHFYFQGNYVAAFENLTAAISGGSHDPRAYYFRGLSAMHLGRTPDAQGDFQSGAQLEMKQSDRFHDVSKSLERVQGWQRRLIENYRLSARVAASRDQENRRMQRYEQIRRAAPPPAAAQPTSPAGEAPATTEPTLPAAESPFAAPATESPAAPATPPATDPFAPPAP
jgi:hypothetical protein